MYKMDLVTEVEIDLEDFHFQFNVWYIVVMIVLNIFATVSNGVSVYSILKTFNINQALYASLLLCAITTTFLMATALAISLIFLTIQDRVQNKFMCSLWSSPAYVSFFMGQYFTCVISSLRYL